MAEHLQNVRFAVMAERDLAAELAAAKSQARFWKNLHVSASARADAEREGRLAAERWRAEAVEVLRYVGGAGDPARAERFLVASGEETI